MRADGAKRMSARGRQRGRPAAREMDIRGVGAVARKSRKCSSIDLRAFCGRTAAVASRDAGLLA